MLLRKNTFVSPSAGVLRSILTEEFLFFNKVSIDDFAQRERVLVNGRVCTDVDTFVGAGDVLTILTPKSFEPVVNEEVSILFEDAVLLVVNKPAPLPVHPAGKYYFNTLTSILERVYGKKQLYPVHRLDKETSGVIVFAKSVEVAQQLSTLFKHQEVHKMYVGVVRGILAQDGQWDWPLKKEQKGVIRNHMVTAADGSEAHTQYRVVSVSGGYSLLCLYPKTGRRHQLRAHASLAGHALVGDKQYGPYPELFEQFVVDPSAVSDRKLVVYLGATRQLLHASTISFPHPVSGVVRTFFAPLPVDLVSFCVGNGLSLANLR